MLKFVQPTFHERINGYSYAWQEWGLSIDIDQQKEKDVELYLYHKNGTGDIQLIDAFEINLMGARSADTFSKRVGEKTGDQYPLSEIWTHISTRTIHEMRKGEPLQYMGKLPASMSLDYLLPPLLEKGQVTNLYAPGGTLKSYVALYIACGIEYGMPLLGGGATGWTPTQQGHVLYLDWESTFQSHNRRLWAIKKGLGISDFQHLIAYRHMSNPLVTDIATIRKMVNDNNFVLVIVDSYTPAQGYGNDPSQLASQMFNCLRSLQCSILVIDHMAKQDIRFGDDTGMPINTVVKFNRSRSVFSLTKIQTPVSDTVYLKMKHTKHNEGRLEADLALKVQFVQLEDDMSSRLDHVEIERTNIETIEAMMVKGNTLRDKILHVLQDNPRLSYKDIADRIGASPNTVSKELSAMKDAELIHNPSRGEWEIVPDTQPQEAESE